MKHFLLPIILLFLFSHISIAQSTYDEGTQAFNPGVNSYTLGSTASGDYSALLINGPNFPTGSSFTRDIVFKFASAGKSIIRAYRGDSWDSYLQFMTTSNLGGIPLVRMHLSGNGNIGIGTTTPTHLLTVAGGIKCREILIDINSGADHVFSSNYNLRSLSEVNAFVMKNKHLPDIPSEKTMQEDGLNVNEFQIKLLQKIEELTLYILQQEERIQHLEKRLKE